MDNVAQFIQGMDSLMAYPPDEIFRLARTTVLYDRELWTQHAQARDQFGNMVRINDPQAVMWDVEGACGKVANPYGIVPPMIIKILDQIVQDIWNTEEDAGWLNDHRTYEHVLILLEEAERRKRGST